MFFFGLLVVVVTSYLLASLSTFLVARQFPDDVIMPGSETVESASFGGQNPAVAVDPMAIVKRNFFDPEETILADGASTDVAVATDVSVSTDDAVTTDDPTKRPAVKTALSLRLLAATPFGSGENDISSCVLAAGKNSVDTYTRQKNPTEPAIKIVRILPRRVEFINTVNNRFEYVDLVDFAKGMDTTAKPEKVDKTLSKKTKKTDETAEISGDGDHFTIPRSEIDKAIADPGKLFTEIRAVPYMEDGQTSGLKLLSVKKGSVFDKLGLRRGDVLKSINNNVLDIPNASKLFDQLKDESQITLDISRQGVAKSMTYDII